MDAVISECGHYRYILSRGDIQKPFVLWVMLNPSTADASIDDPTIEACWRITRAQGYEHMVVVNLYAWRATKPADMLQVGDPVGPDNNRWIYNASARASLVICGWGNHAKRDRAEEVKEILTNDNPRLFAVGINANGSPKHPLYTAADVLLEVWPRQSGKRTKRVDRIK